MIYAHARTHTHTHTHTIGWTALDEGSVRRKDLLQTTHNTYKRQTSVPPAGFEPAIPASGHLDWPSTCFDPSTDHQQAFALKCILKVKSAYCAALCTVLHCALDHNEFKERSVTNVTRVCERVSMTLMV